MAADHVTIEEYVPLHVWVPVALTFLKRGCRRRSGEPGTEVPKTEVTVLPLHADPAVSSGGVMAVFAIAATTSSFACVDTALVETVGSVLEPVLAPLTSSGLVATIPVK